MPPSPRAAPILTPVNQFAINGYLTDLGLAVFHELLERRARSPTQAIRQEELLVRRPRCGRCAVTPRPIVTAGDAITRHRSVRPKRPTNSPVVT
jgi:hypothetical protein